MAGISESEKRAIDILLENSDLFHSNGFWDFLIHFLKVYCSISHGSYTI